MVTQRLNFNINVLETEIERYLYVMIFYGSQSDCITEAELLNIADSGDLLLFETHNIGAALQRVFTSSKYGIGYFLLRSCGNYSKNISSIYICSRRKCR